jgi:response regulator RpfG family c-di-GMP phosphodiesterase
MAVDDRKTFKSFDIESDIEVLEAESSAEAKAILKENQGNISAIVTSFVLPDVDGIDFLRDLKRDLSSNYIPSIVITNDINEKNLVESMNAGAFYYLERPFGESVFVSVLQKALKDYTTYVFYLGKAQNVNISRLICRGQFAFQTFKEGYEVADWLASLCAGQARDDLVVGFIELLINAVEHGNLEVGYDEKSEMMKEGNYIEKVLKRLELPKFKDRYVLVEFEHRKTELEVTICDEGKGFDFENYLVMDKKRMFHSHGKGIIMAKNLYFDELFYTEPGNKVTAKIKLSGRT